MVRDKRKVERPLVKCPHPDCDYTCRGKQALGRHIHYHHPEQQRTPRVSIKPETLRDLLQYTSDGIADKQLQVATDQISVALRKHSIDLRLTLVAIAAAKAERLVTLDALVTRVTGALRLKLEGEYLDNLPVPGLVGLLKYLNQLEDSDAEFLKGVLSMKEGSQSAFLLQTVELLRSSTGDTQVRSIERLGGIVQQGEPQDSYLSRLIESVLCSEQSTGEAADPAAGDAGAGPGDPRRV